jgi:urease accessory protein UreF
VSGFLSIIPTLVAALIGGGGVVAIVNAVARRRLTHVEAATQLNDQAIEWAKHLEASAAEARNSAVQAWAQASASARDAADARREATDARREATEARMEAAEIGRELRTLRSVITDPAALQEPAATIARLRAMVGMD